MFTDDDKRELKRLMQKRRRSLPTGTRMAMIAWNNGENGKAARKKYYASENGKAARKKYYETGVMAPGSKLYMKDKAKDRESITKAEKHRHEWTAKEEAELIAMVKQGKSAKEIADALSRSIRGIERKREKLMRHCYK